MCVLKTRKKAMRNLKFALAVYQHTIAVKINKESGAHSIS